MLTIRFLVAIAIYLLTTGVHGVQAGVIDIGSQRELFVDRHLIDRLEGATLKLHSPQLTPLAPGSFRGAYNTVIKDGDLYRRYYRAVVEGYQGEGYDGHPGEYTAYAESRDGIHWTRPNLGLFEINGSRDNNADTGQCFSVQPQLQPLSGYASGGSAEASLQGPGRGPQGWWTGGVRLGRRDQLEEAARGARLSLPRSSRSIPRMSRSGPRPNNSTSATTGPGRHPTAGSDPSTGPLPQIT